MRLFVAFLTAACLLHGQVQTSMNGPLSEYSAPWFGSGNYWRKTFGHQDYKVQLQGPIKLRDYVVDGKLRLSLRNYLDLVVANNTDIGIQRMTLEYPKNAIQRALSIFDPILRSSFSATRAQSPATNQLQGASVVSSLTQPFSASINQLTPFSTTIFSNFSAQKLSTNDQYSLYNPALTSSFQVGFTQPLLQGRGAYYTRLPILIAKSQLLQTEQAFYNQIINLLANSENAYWDALNARERLKVQQQALQLAEAALTRARREVELGATSPLEIFQPEQQAATARVGVVQFEYQMRVTEEALRRQMGADLDAEIRKLPIELTESLDPNIEEAEFNHEQMVQQALTKRFDLQSIKTNLAVNDLQIRTAQERYKPLLNLTGQYSTQGRGGNFYIRPGDAAYPVNGNGSPIIIPGGLTDSFGQWFNYNTFSFSLNLTLPLRNRSAGADIADAVAAKRQNTLQQRTIEQQVRQDVLTALTNVESSRAGIKLAQVALDFARKRVEADQKRYDLGAITLFFLLSAQTDLTQAQSNLVSQTVQYRRNMLALQQSMGSLLDERGVVLR